MEAVREALSKPKVATDDSICFAVVLLMLTAVSFSRQSLGVATHSGANMD